MSNFEKTVIAILIVLVSGTITLFILYTRIDNTTRELSNSSLASEIIDSPNEDDVEGSTTSAVIKKHDNLINDLVASSSTLLDRIDKLEKNSSTTSVTKSIVRPSFQKQIIYIGSASTQQHDWTDSGVEIRLNSSDYPSGINAIFEVGLSTVGGEAWARLVNKTTGSIMTITEISHSTSTTTWKSSPPFKLYDGDNTYALEIKSTSDEVANFSGARIVVGE